MTPAERALLRDLSVALGRYAIVGGTLAYIAALQQRIREALAKKGKRK